MADSILTSKHAIEGGVYDERLTCMMPLPLEPGGGGVYDERLTCMMPIPNDLMLNQWSTTKIKCPRSKKKKKKKKKEPLAYGVRHQRHKYHDFLSQFVIFTFRSRTTVTGLNLGTPSLRGSKVNLTKSKGFTT